MRIKLNVFLFCAFFFFYAKGDSQENLSCNFYNKTESLGIGLVKVEKQFITIKNPKLNKNVLIKQIGKDSLSAFFFT